MDVKAKSLAEYGDAFFVAGKQELIIDCLTVIADIICWTLNREHWNGHAIHSNACLQKKKKTKQKENQPNDVCTSPLGCILSLE